MIRRAAPLVLSLTLTAIAQEPPSLKESIEVQLTNLDVVVTDAQGNHVTGLTPADFEIIEGGQVRQITNLSEYRRMPDAPMATAPRRILVAIDNATIAVSARKQTVAAVRAKVDELLSDKNDQLMIVTINGSPRQRTPWTSDRAEIARVLDEIERDAAAPRTDLAEMDNMINEILHYASGGGPRSSVLARRRQQQSSSGNRGANAPMQEDEEPYNPGVDFNMALSRARSYAANSAAETQRTISSIAESLDYFRTASDGKRLTILVGGSLPIFPGSDVYQRLDSAMRDIERHERNTGAFDALQRSRRQSSTAMEKVSMDMTRELDGLAAYAKGKGVAFYAVNPELNDRASQAITSRHAGRASQDFATANTAVDGFQRLALATGGESHMGRNATVALTDVQKDLDSYYSIGYRSGFLTADTNVVVKAKDGLKTRAVLTTTSLAPEWRIADTVVNNHAKAPEMNDLGIILVANPVKREGDTRQIKVNVMIPFDSLRLIKDGPEYNCSFTVFVSVGDASGGANPKRETRNFRWNEATVSKLRGKTISYGVDLTVGPGRDRVSVGILDLASGTTGYGRALLAQAQ